MPFPAEMTYTVPAVGHPNRALEQTQRVPLGEPEERSPRVLGGPFGAPLEVAGGVPYGGALEFNPRSRVTVPPGLVCHKCHETRDLRTETPETLSKFRNCPPCRALFARSKQQQRSRKNTAAARVYDNADKFFSQCDYAHNQAPTRRLDRLRLRMVWSAECGLSPPPLYTAEQLLEMEHHKDHLSLLQEVKNYFKEVLIEPLEQIMGSTFAIRSSNYKKNNKVYLSLLCCKDEKGLAKTKSLGLRGFTNKKRIFHCNSLIIGNFSPLDGCINLEVSHHSHDVCLVVDEDGNITFAADMRLPSDPEMIQESLGEDQYAYQRIQSPHNLQQLQHHTNQLEQELAVMAAAAAAMKAEKGPLSSTEMAAQFVAAHLQQFTQQEYAPSLVQRNREYTQSQAQRGRGYAQNQVQQGQEYIHNQVQQSQDYGHSQVQQSQEYAHNQVQRTQEYAQNQVHLAQFVQHQMHLQSQTQKLKDLEAMSNENIDQQLLETGALDEELSHQVATMAGADRAIGDGASSYDRWSQPDERGANGGSESEEGTGVEVGWSGHIHLLPDLL